MKIHLWENTKLAYIYLLKWVFLSLLAGILGTIIVHSFKFLLSGITYFLLSHPVPQPVYAVFGALFTGGIIYKLQPDASGEGIPSYIQGIRFREGSLPLSVTLFKYLSSLATLSTFGNGGVVGPVGRVSAGVMSFVSSGLRKIGFRLEDIHTASICGMAAAVGAIFHTSIGGGIFAVEIIQRKSMGYKDLFPAILSSSTAVFLSKAFGLGTFYSIRVPDAFMDVRMIGWLLALSALAGICGGFYTRLYAFIRQLIKREKGRVLIKVIAGSAIASGIAWAINPELLGVSTGLIQAIITGDIPSLSGRLTTAVPIGWVLVIMLICKALCNCITVGSGMSAGFTGPAAIIGMLLGASFTYFLNIGQSSPTFYAFIAGGFSGMLASSMNIPLAAAVMTIEIFGLQYGLPAGLAAIVGFQINRHFTIYDYAVTGAGVSYGKTEISGSS